MKAMTNLLLVCGVLMTGVFLSARESRADQGDPTDLSVKKATDAEPPASKTTPSQDDAKNAIQMSCDVAACDHSCTVAGFCYGICESGAGCHCYDYHDPNC